MHAEKDVSPRREEVDDCRLMRENCWGFEWGGREGTSGRVVELLINVDMIKLHERERPLNKLDR